MKLYRIINKLLIFLIFLKSFAVESVAQNYRDSLDLELNRLYIQLQLPGFNVVIVSQDRILYQKGFGYADIKNKKLFNLHTIENIGSVSKTFIAVALMKAVEKGYFDLETGINAVLPFKVANPYFPEKPIKVKHLVTHTSGIIDNDSIYNRSYQFKYNKKTDSTVLAFMNEHGYTGGIQDTTLKSFLYSYLYTEGKLYEKKNFYNSQPGSRSSYSNIGSAIIAYLIEIKSGLSFADFTQKYILKPLRMKHSGWFLNEIDINNHAIPYFNKASAFPFYSLITYPDGGLRTSASDLSKYVSEMMFTLNGNPRLLSRNLCKVMFTPRFSLNNLPQNFSLETRNKGVLWNLYSDGFIGHDGDDPGVSTNIMFNQNIGIIFMTNIYMDDRSEFLKVLKKYGAKLAGGG